MWKIYFKDRAGGQNPDFWAKKMRDLDVGFTKEQGRCDYISDVFLKYFPRKGRILDGGCGVGQHVLAYREMGYEVEGIDFSEEVIKKIIEFDNNAPCRKGNVLKIEAPDSSYECYYSIGIFEHFEEGPAVAIKEARRILKEGGTFILVVPYENMFRKIKFNMLNFAGKLSGHSYMGTNIGFIRKADTYSDAHGENSEMKFHEYICSRKEILRTISSNGFKPEYSSPCSIVWGLLEIPFMKKLYGLINNSLRKEDGPVVCACTPRVTGSNPLKDIIIYEKRDGFLKSFFVSLFGYAFGNLFLVVSRKA